MAALNNKRFEVAQGGKRLGMSKRSDLHKLAIYIYTYLIHKSIRKKVLYMGRCLIMIWLVRPFSSVLYGIMRKVFHHVLSRVPNITKQYGWIGGPWFLLMLFTIYHDKLRFGLMVVIAISSAV